MLCRACPFECGVDRASALGVCRATDRIELALAQLHHWEEPPISGTRGSGAIFFSHCNLRCRFCQNYDISQQGRGRETTPERLVRIMLELEQQGAHNINLVSPTHYSDQLLPILEAARPKLGVPFVWNSNGYEKAETLRRFEGLVTVFLPDLKYANDELARACSSAPDYFRHATTALLEMKHQVGTNRFDDDGIMQRGMIVRHLVLPGHIENSKRVLTWLRDSLGPETLVSLMSQYYPVQRDMTDGDMTQIRPGIWDRVPGSSDRVPSSARLLESLNRRLTPAEYDEVRAHFEDLEFDEGFAQELDSASKDYTPDFNGTGI